MPIPSSVTGGPGLSLLLADDDHAYSEMVAKVLAHSLPIARLDTVSTAGECLERLRESAYDLLILDYRLEDRDGLSVLRDMREAGMDVPVVLVTAYGDEDVAVQAMKEGAYDYLNKTSSVPTELPRLAALVVERHRLHRALAGADARYRAVFDLARPGLLVLAWPQGDVLDLNPAMEQLAGRSRDELLGRPVSDLFPRRERGGLVDLLRTGPGPHRMCLRRPDGDDVPVDVDGVVTQVGADREEVIIQVADQSQAELARARERELTDQLIQSEKLAAVGQLISGVAHELNNPLGTIVAYTQLLSEGERLDVQSRSDMDRIRAEAARCKRIVNGLLSLVRQSERETEATDLNDVVRRTAEIFAYEFRTSGIRLVLDLDADLPDTLVDGHQIQQVLVNLVQNAAQAIQGQRTGGEIRLYTCGQGQSLVLGVCDDGPGIPPEHLRRIFDPFFTTKPPGRGTGLGLSLSYNLVHDHGGRMEVESEPGLRTEFRVVLPLRMVSADAQPEEVREAPCRSTRRTGARILVLDDEPGYREVFVRTLVRGRHQALAVGDREEALRLLDSESFDLVVCDMRMPGWSGEEAHHEIELRDPELARRMIFCTGDILGPETRAFVQRTGAPALQKPFDLSALLDLVQSVLEGAGRGQAEARGACRVLLVDDSPDLIAVLGRMVGPSVSRDAVVAGAEGGGDALRQLATADWDMVFLDLHMPDIHGTEVLAWIREHRPSLYVVVMTGHVDRYTPEDLRVAGADDFLSKPFSPVEVELVIDRYKQQVKAQRVMGQQAIGPQAAAERGQG